MNITACVVLEWRPVFTKRKRTQSFAQAQRNGYILILPLVLMLAPGPFSRWIKHCCACVVSENEALENLIPRTFSFPVLRKKLRICVFFGGRGGLSALCKKIHHYPYLRCRGHHRIQECINNDIFSV